MKRGHLAILIVGLIVVAILGAYAAFGLLLIGFDVASYTSDGVTVAEPGYDDIRSNAAIAGYDIERVESTGFHPDGVDELDAELGPDYEVFRVVFDYSETQRMWATFYADEGITVVTVFADDVRGPVTESELPPEEWLVDRLTVLFEMDETTAAGYVEDLEADLRAADPSDPGAGTPSVDVDESVDFPGAYAAITDASTAVETNASPGTGWHERHYVADDRKIGSIDFVLARSTITHRADGTTYRIHVDYHGGLRIEAETRAYRSLEEAEVRAAFRAMFERLGIPPETVDHFHLEYRGSVW